MNEKENAIRLRSRGGYLKRK